MRKLLPSSFANLTSLIGGIIATVTLFLIVLLYLMDVFGPQKNPYLGVVLYMALPPFLILGLAIAIFGAFRTRRRILAGDPNASRLPHIDLNDARQRRTVFLLAVGSFLFLVVSAFGSYQTYEFTDSVDFCGRVCHSVMKPEYTAYLASPHARVPCVECHIGAGATWFVRSKISGSYQVYSTLLKKYSRPIATPVANLRPARETCEQCHWPKQFYSAKLQGRTYYLADEKNSPCQINLLVKIGGGDPRHGATTGIHYHMYLASEVKYIATDPRRDIIPYVEARGADGTMRVYRSTENALTPEQESKQPKHLVDCIECHNRPTHIFHHPAESVDQAMTAGRIKADLPEVKRLLVETLEKPFKTEPEALAGIRQSVQDFYQSHYPQVASTRRADIDAAIDQAAGIYRVNFFPEMRVSWQGFPNHIGHMYSPGCFRCHDNKHVSQDGHVISKACNVCHTILSEQAPGDAKPRVSIDGVDFKHPVDIGEAWKEGKCSDCHAGQQQ